MFLRYIDFLFVPFRNIRNKWLKAKTVKGNVKMEVGRVKSHGKRVKGYAGKAKGYAGKAQEKAGAARDQAGQIQGQVAGQGGGQVAQEAPVNPPQIVAKGFIFKKHFCGACSQQLDKSWDHCPYCAQTAAPPPAAGAPKTQAFMVDAAGTSGHMQLLGWLVPLSGAQKGELFTLSPVSQIGTEPTCNVVLTDQFMSSIHAEIKAEGGRWILRDLGSTNGTFVNDQRIDQRELVDNDVVKFGQSPAKFKSL